MRVTKGLMPGQVLQRRDDNRGAVRVEGTCRRAGPVQVRLVGLKSGQPAGRWTGSGRAGEGRFVCEVAGIPCGGPYRVELRVREAGRQAESCAVDEVFVGDVWMLGGQSNMAGCGELDRAPAPHAMVRCFSVADRWQEAKDPLHFMAEAVDRVHHMLVGRKRRPSAAEIRKERKIATHGTGVGVFFGKEMVRRTRVPQGLIPCAHGGTSMAQWSPALKSKGGASLYGAMLRRYRALGQPVAGMLWYQGESDANMPEGYTGRMEDLVASVRRDFGLPNLPWAVVQIGRVMGDFPDKGWNSIQEQERCLPQRIRHLDVVPAVDLELVDNIHLSAAGHKALAKRLARCMARLALGRREKGGIRLQGIGMQTRGEPSGRAQTVIEVTFANVAGRLQGGERPMGFSLSDERGEPYDAFYRTRVSGRKVQLETYASSVLLETMSLHYGQGGNPAVTIRDTDEMGLPVFGPIRIAERSGTQFLGRWRVMKVSEESLSKASKTLPRYKEEKRGWRAARKGAGTAAFMVFPVRTDRPRNGVYLMRATVTAARDCRVELAMGADSPFAAYLNGTCCLADTDALNPCTADQYQAAVNLRKGGNEVAVLFDTRGGAGWGICARFKSTDAKKLPGGLVKV